MEGEEIFFSTDERPSGITLLGGAKRGSEACECQIKDFACACGAIIGFELVMTCAPCSAETEDLHPWRMPARCVEAKLRSDAEGVPLAWPPATPKRFTPAVHHGENDPTIAGWVRTPCVPPLPQFSCDVAVAPTTPLGDLNGRAHGGSAKRDRSDRRTLDEREEQTAKDGLILFAKEAGLGSREQLLHDKEYAHDRFVKELHARDVALEKRERTVREKEQVLQHEHAAAWTQVGEAQDEAHHAEILAKAHADVAAELKNQNVEADARARRAEDDALARVGELQSMRSVADHLRAELAMKAIEVQNVTGEITSLRASRRQVEEELAAKSAQLLAKDEQALTVRNELVASNEGLVSMRATARRFEDQLETLRAALRQGDSIAASSVPMGARPVPRQRISACSGLSVPRFHGELSLCPGCPGWPACQCEATTASATVMSQAVPPSPANRRAAWTWWRGSRTPSCGENYVPFPVRLQSPWPLAWVFRAMCCCDRRRTFNGLYMRQY